MKQKKINILKRVYIRFIWGFLLKIKLYFSILFSGENKVIYLFGVPVHSNLGDQAQKYCILKWLNENYPKHKIIQLSWKTSTDNMLKFVKKKINPDDLIYCHSGYLLIDHHKELPIYQKVVALFPNNKIVILPQTINLKKDEVVKKTTDIFNAHTNLTLICRDDISYDIAKNIFHKCKLLLYPDIVTTLIGYSKYDLPKKGVLFCMRNDIEGYYGKKEIEELRSRYDKNVKNILWDTTILTPYPLISYKMDQLIEDMLRTFASFEVVITDRYHGTIFSLIAGTPVVVIATNDHKVSSGVKWFPESFKENVYFAKDLDEAYRFSQEILIRTKKAQEPTDYFQKEYYSKLKNKL